MNAIDQGPSGPKPQTNGLAIASLVLGILMLAIAVPNFLKARTTAQAAACRANLKTMEAAKAMWALENKKQLGDLPAESDLFGPGKAIRAKPACPAGGQYTINPVGTPAVCSIPGHRLEP
jgi:competence protein ComGC